MNGVTNQELSESIAQVELSAGDGEAVTNETSSQETEFGHPGLTDGRQSERALAIARGTRRQLHMLGLQSLPEMPLPNGRRADIIALSDSGEIWIIEIKSSLEDFRSDHKWPEYWEFSDKFFFAVDADFPIEVLPEDTGHIIADRFGAEIVRMSDRNALPAARRKAVTLRVARAACRRHHNLADPEFGNQVFRQL